MTARPRVVFAYRYGLVGGVATQLLNRLPAFGEVYDVRVLFERDRGALGAFPAGVAQVAGDAQARREVLTDLAPDVLVAIDSPAFFASWDDAGRPGRLVVEVHTTTQRGLEQLAALTPDRGIAAILTVSGYLRDQLAAAGLERVAPIAVVPNCLGPAWFDPPEPASTDRPLVLWVGKLDDHKRWDVALDVLTMAVRDQQARGLLVGGYTARDEQVAGLLERLPPTVDWWPHVAYERMPRLYRTAAASGGALLVTSRNESFGMTVAEAALMDCPVVAPRVGALPELLPDAALVDDGDWDAAAALLGRVLAGSGLRDELVASTRQRVVARVRPERALAAFRAVVDPLLAG